MMLSQKKKVTLRIIAPVYLSLICGVVFFLAGAVGQARASELYQSLMVMDAHAVYLSHQQGAPLMKGLSGPDELANLIDASLVKDPKGEAKLDPARCKLNGSCASPNTYLNGIHAWHPRVPVTLQGLSKFIRGLKGAEVPGGEFYSARMVGDELDLTSGFKRSLMRGELAWYDTQSGEPILFENCGNIMLPVPVSEVKVETKKCDFVHIFNDKGEVLHLAVAAPDGETLQDPRHCLDDFPPPCSYRCSFAASERDTGTDAKKIGTIQNVAEGDTVISIPLAYTLFVCKDGYRTQNILPADFDKHGEAWLLRTPADKPGAFALYWKQLKPAS